MKKLTKSSVSIRAVNYRIKFMTFDGSTSFRTTTNINASYMIYRLLGESVIYTQTPIGILAYKMKNRRLRYKYICKIWKA